jgi:hypothetical protein
VRRAWLGGSLPGNTPEQAMTLALDELGPYLLALPGGETRRPNWAASIVDELAQTSLFTIAKPGEGTDYDDLPQLAPVNGDLSTLDIGYYTIYQAESPIAHRLVTQRGLALSFQVDIAGPFDLAMFTVGPRRYLKYYKAFEAATLRDIMAIFTHDETVLFQLSVPLELVGSLTVPAMARHLVTRKLVKKITDFVSLCPVGLRLGVHLCLGDYHHKAKGHLPQLAPLTDFANTLLDTWPPGYPLAYLTLPLAEAELPPVLEPAWYTDLARLRALTGVRIVLGICHEKVTTGALRPIVTLADSLLKQEVAVGASCGLALRGSRTLDDVRTILRQQRELCAG